MADIEVTDPLYAKRVIREINKLLRDNEEVYVKNYPQPTRVLKVTYGSNMNKVLVTDDFKVVTEHEPIMFYTKFGTEITASRKK